MGISGRSLLLLSLGRAQFQVHLASRRTRTPPEKPTLIIIMITGIPVRDPSFVSNFGNLHISGCRPFCAGCRGAARHYPVPFMALAFWQAAQLPIKPQVAPPCFARFRGVFLLLALCSTCPPRILALSVGWVLLGRDLFEDRVKAKCLLS